MPNYSANLSYWVDWDRDGSYGHVLSNITAYVMAASWTLGFQEPYQAMGGPCQLSLTLDNRDGAWNVLKSGSTFGSVLRGEALVQIRYSYAAQTWYLGTYKFSAMSFDPKAFGERVVVMIATDWFNDFMGQIYDPPLTLNTTTGQAVEDAFVNSGVPGYPLGSLNFIVDASTLDETTKLPDYLGEGYLFCHDGQTTLDYVGDNLDRGQGITLANFIREMCYAELTGRFRFEVNTASGKPYYSFYSRTTLGQAADAGNTHTIDQSDFFEADYTYADGLTNFIEITVFPRTLGDAGTELARMENGMVVQARGSRSFSVRYRDPDNPQGSCAAVTVITPVANTDYTANSEADGSGTDLTSYVAVGLENLTNAAKVTVTSRYTDRLYVTLLKIRGTPMTAAQAMTLTAADGASIALNGIRKDVRTVTGVDDEELVQSFADWHVRNWSEPRAEYRSITFDYTEDTDAGLATYVYEPLSVTEPLIIQDHFIEDTADAQTFWVCGMRSEVTDEGAWIVTLILENYLNMAGFWRLEHAILGILDETTRLAF